VRSACVDIGSNTTRLLVAEIDGDGIWRELMTQRAYTLIGKQTGSSGRLPEKVIANTTEVVSTQVRLAREMGADDITIVATAAVRGAPNRDKLLDAVLARTGIPIRVLSGTEEAQLAFIGATKRLGTPAEGTIAVIDDSGGTLTAPILADFAGVICLGGTVRAHLGILTREHAVPCLMAAEIDGLTDGDEILVEYSKRAADAYADAETAAAQRARILKVSEGS